MSDIRTIRDALEYLPDSCRYHDEAVDGHDPRRYGGACCATGEPALARRRALAALGRLSTPPLPANPRERPVF